MKIREAGSRLAFAVGDMDEARKFFESVLGAEFGPVEDVSEFQFRYRPFRLGGMSMQLMEPYDPESVISHFLMKRGHGFHHLSIEVDDLDAAVAELGERGIRVASRHEYDEPHEGRRWSDAFIHPSDACGVLVQLVQRRGSGDESNS